MRYINLFFIILFILECREKPHTTSTNSQDLTNHEKKLSLEDIAEVKDFLFQHMIKYSIHKPDSLDASNDYTENAISLRMESFAGIEVPILDNCVIDNKYLTEVIDELPYSEFSVKCKIYGKVNLTKTKVIKNPDHEAFRYGVIKDKGKWKIHVDGNQPLPVPINILIEHYKLNKNQKMVSELEAWEKEINGKKKESTP